MFENIRAIKSLGQHFLKDPHYLIKTADAARIGPEDQVLEIGPGLGHLTAVLIQRARKVLAIELDNRLIPRLQGEFRGVSNFELLHADALEYDYASLEGRWKVVANLPYYISTPIIQKFISHREKFITLTLMLQREVADRIAAPPGGKEYGRLTVMLAPWVRVEPLFDIGTGAFTPPPKVVSTFFALHPHPAPPFAIGDEAAFARVVSAAFQQRRKTLRNSLRGLLDAEGIASAGVDPGARPETLAPAQFASLAAQLRT